MEFYRLFICVYGVRNFTCFARFNFRHELDTNLRSAVPLFFVFRLHRLNLKPIISQYLDLTYTADANYAIVTN